MRVGKNRFEAKGVSLSIFLVAGLLAASSCLLAESADMKLSWGECVKLARENHPDLIIAREDLKQVKADLDIEISSSSPDVTASASGKRSRSATTEKTSNSYSYKVDGQLLVFDGFKTASEISNAVKTLKAEEYNYNVTSSDIRLDLRNAFVNLLKAQELISLTKEIARRREENLKLVKLRYEAGREHRGSLLTAEADLAQAEFEVAQAERSIVLEERRLSKELGFGEVKEINVKGNFSPETDYGPKPDIDELAHTTPFLKELIAKKEAARYSVQSAEADFFPEVYLDTSYGRSGSSLLPRGESLSAGISVSLPLFEGGSRFSEVAKAKSQYVESMAAERSGRDSVLMTLETTWKDLKDALETYSVKEKFLEAARERAKIAGTQYETGLISFDDWIIIEDNLVSAQKEYLDAQAQILSKEAYWIQAIGGTLEYDKR